ncbi:nucleotidyltransferase [Streptococcus infantarius]|uniref:nucleotidyltransferase domain-containing protein n=1 Tax=Streptococcus infantarius TaxID=102684 RepID=UPI0022E58604|nr:nucleotidyltransferase [Streptococcus infantarius]
MNKDEMIREAMKGIELSLTMEKNAREKYHALYKYLKSNGVRYDFEPQGSFLIGTVIRPFKDGEDKNYDLDIVAISCLLKNETTPEKVKNILGDSLKESEIYSDKLKKEDENCWTLQYAEIANEVGFSLDLVPAVSEKTDDYIPYNDALVSITQKNNDGYVWKKSNSLGFGKWFLDINKKFLTTELEEEQNRFLISNESYARIEEIPKYAYKTNLQRAIQFIKRHRDVYYSNSKHSWKPSTVLITAMVTDSAKSNPLASISEIISNFVYDFCNDLISIKHGLVVKNPVDEFDNLASEISIEQWSVISIWVQKLGELINCNDERTIKLGLQRNINFHAFGDLRKNTTKEVAPVKPWRSL